MFISREHFLYLRGNEAFHYKVGTVIKIDKRNKLFHSKVKNKDRQKKPFHYKVKNKDYMQNKRQLRS